MVGLPKVTFGLPNLLLSQKFYKKYYINKSWPVLYEEGPAWFSRNFFHAAASAARPSNEVGSKNWMFSSNFSAWFLMVSTLAVFNHTWYSKSCTLTVVWPISFLRTWSLMALMCCNLMVCKRFFEKMKRWEDKRVGKPKGHFGQPNQFFIFV